MLYRDTYTLTLPFGKYRIRRPSLLSLVAAGHFPSELTSVVWKVQSGEATINQIMTSVDHVKDWAVLVEKFIPHILVSPAVGKETQVKPDADGVLAGTVALESMPDMEKQLILLCAMWGYPSDEEKEEAAGGGGAPDLKQFRSGAGSADTRPSGTEVRTETF